MNESLNGFPLAARARRTSLWDSDLQIVFIGMSIYIKIYKYTRWCLAMSKLLMLFRDFMTSYVKVTVVILLSGPAHFPTCHMYDIDAVTST